MKRELDVVLRECERGRGEGAVVQRWWERERLEALRAAYYARG